MHFGIESKMQQKWLIMLAAKISAKVSLLSVVALIVCESDVLKPKRTDWPSFLAVSEPNPQSPPQTCLWSNQSDPEDTGHHSQSSWVSIWHLLDKIVKLTASQMTSRWILSSFCVISLCLCRYQPSKFNDLKNFLRRGTRLRLNMYGQRKSTVDLRISPVQPRPITLDPRGQLRPTVLQCRHKLLLTEGSDLRGSLEQPQSESAVMSEQMMSSSSSPLGQKSNLQPLPALTFHGVTDLWSGIRLAMYRSWRRDHRWTITACTHVITLTLLSTVTAQWPHATRVKQCDCLHLTRGMMKLCVSSNRCLLKMALWASDGRFLWKPFSSRLIRILSLWRNVL